MEIIGLIAVVLTFIVLTASFEGLLAWVYHNSEKGLCVAMFGSMYIITLIIIVALELL